MSNEALRMKGKHTEHLLATHSLPLRFYYFRTDALFEFVSQKRVVRSEGML